MAAELTPRRLTVYGGSVVLGTALGAVGVVFAVPEPQRAPWHWASVGLASLSLMTILGSLRRRAARGVVGAADIVTLVRAGAVAVVATWAVFSTLGLLAPTSW